MVSSALDKFATADPTFYPVDQSVGEDSLQTFIAELLRPLIAALCASRGDHAFIGADQFIYYEQFHPEKVVAPDIYVLPGVSPEARVSSWKVWQTDIVPSFALEIVSSNHRKDRLDSPARYAELGVGEVILFDPDYRARRDGARFRVYRRLARRGLRLVEETNADRVRSKALKCWIRAIGEGAAVRLRVALAPRGDALLATDAERAAATAERAAMESERAERAEAEARRADAETARLRAELARLRASVTRRVAAEPKKAPARKAPATKKRR